jgi:hypothetical protein
MSLLEFVGQPRTRWEVWTARGWAISRGVVVPEFSSGKLILRITDAVMGTEIMPAASIDLLTLKDLAVHTEPVKVDIYVAEGESPVELEILRTQLSRNLWHSVLEEWRPEQGALH